MGIFRFYSQFLRRIGDGVVVSTLPSSSTTGEVRVEGVLFDLNGMLHSIAQKVFMYGKSFEEAKKGGDVSLEAFRLKKSEESNKTFKELMDVYASTLTDELNQILMILSPKQYVIIAVDGMAPDAKINQQRNRRYKGFIDSSQSGGGDDGDLSKPLAGFDSSLISPGTNFMVEVDILVKAWLTNSMETRKEAVKRATAAVRKGGKASLPRGTLPAVVVYSSHLVHGEGEHKAFQTLKELFNEGTIFQDVGAHIVYGADADLSMLSLLSPLRNIFLSRENLRQYINIEELYIEIRRRMTNDETAKTSEFDRETICRDFVVMSNLIGNDFLPHSPAFQNIASTILSSYAEVGSPLTYIPDPSPKPVSASSPEIILSSLGNLFYILAREEVLQLEQHAAKELNDVGTQFERVKPSKSLLESYDRKTKTIDLDLFRSKHYAEAAKIRNKTLILSSKKPIFTNTSSVMRRMVCDYVATFGWMLKYYASGGKAINWKHSYKFVVAPLANDIAHVIIKEFPKIYDSEVFSPPSSPKKKLSSPKKTSPSPSASSKVLTANDLYEHSCVLAKDKGVYGFSSVTGDPRTRGQSANNLAAQLLTITPPASLKKVLANAPDLVQLVYESPDLGRFMLDDAKDIDIYLDGMRAKYEGIAILPDVEPLEIVEILKTIETRYREIKVGESKLKKEIKEAEGFGPAIDKFGRPRVETHRVKALIPTRLAVFTSEEPIVFKPSEVVRGTLQRSRGGGGVLSSEEGQQPKPQLLVSDLSEKAAVGGDMGGGRWGFWDYEEEARREKEDITPPQVASPKRKITVSSPKKKPSVIAAAPLPVSSIFPELSKLEEMSSVVVPVSKERKPRAKKVSVSTRETISSSPVKVAAPRKPRAKKTSAVVDDADIVVPKTRGRKKKE